MINDHFVFQIDVNLKGGLGLSIVNSLPEELLYISLKNIMLMYRENSKAVTMEISVSNIQVNNAMKMSSVFVVVLVLSNIQKSSKGRSFFHCKLLLAALVLRYLTVPKLCSKLRNDL